MSVKFFLKNTKIVSTFGPSITFDLNILDPSSSSPELKAKVEEVIRSVFWEGVNCVRYNFSHGSFDENATRYAMIHKVQKDFVLSQKDARRYLKPIVMLADTKGPEIRVFDMGKGVAYSKGQEIVINCVSRIQGSDQEFSVVDATGKYDMSNDCKVGNYVLVEDGKLKLKIVSVDKSNSSVRVRVMNDAFVKTNKRINLPGADYSMDFLSAKDVVDIKYAVDKGFEYIALSFVNKKENVLDVKKLVFDYCKEKGVANMIKVYSKIETLQSCHNLDEIIEVSDGIMIARGDLGLEIPYYEVPYWTKVIIKKCWLANKPVITATQMLDSLERNVVATRAEVSDVYRAAELGSDCTMLSGETAQGQFPILAVETMTHIVFESEKHFDSERFSDKFDSAGMKCEQQESKSRFDSFRQSLLSNKSASILAMKCEDIDFDFLQKISSLRLKIPMFAFMLVNNVEEYCDDPKWQSSSYLKMKNISEIALSRGINLVFVDGDAKKTSAQDMFKECFKLYTKEHFTGSMLASDDGGMNWAISSN